MRGAARVRMAILATAILAPASSVRADPDRARAELAFKASEPDCPDEASFRNLVIARLGYDPFQAGARVKVTVDVSKQSDKLVGRAVIDRGQASSGTRVLSGEIDRCEALATAIATTVAMALDPGRTLAKAEGREPPPPVSPTPPTVLVIRERDEPPPTPPAQPPSVPSAPPARVSLLGGVGGSASVGVAPGPTLGADVGVTLQRNSLSLELSGRGETTVGDTRVPTGDRVDVTVYSAALAPCAHLGGLSGCVLVRLGAFQSRSSDVVTPTLRTSTYGAAGLRGAYTLPLGSTFALRGAVEGALPLVRMTLHIDGAPVWTAPELLGGVSIALLTKFL